MMNNAEPSNTSEYWLVTAYTTQINGYMTFTSMQHPCDIAMNGHQIIFALPISEQQFKAMQAKKCCGYKARLAY